MEWIQAFDNTATSVAASQMRNALNRLAETVQDPATKKVFLEIYGDDYMIIRKLTYKIS